MKKEITNFLLENGISPRLKGFHYLRDAIEMTIHNGGMVPAMHKGIYAEIAKKYKTKVLSIERAMRYAVEMCNNDLCELSNKEFLANAAILLSVEDR